MSDDDAPVQEPEFGPGGYLPDRASRRARKIVLRAPMGIQWVIGSLVVGVIVAIAGWLALRDTTPQAPYVEVPTAVADAPGGIATWTPDGTDTEILVVTSSTRPRIFAWDGSQPPVLCGATGLLEAPDGSAWRLTGRGLGGTPSLAEHPLVVDDGVLYVDPSTTIDAPAPSDDPVETGCV